MNKKQKQPGWIWGGVFLSALLIVFAFPAQADMPIAPGHPDLGAEVGKAAESSGPRMPLIAGPTDIKNLNTGLEYATIQLAIDDILTLDGHVLEVQVATHAEGIVTVTKELTIQGMAGGATIQAMTNTGTSSDARAWFLVTAPNMVVKDLTFDGNGFLIYQGFRIKGGGDNPSFDNCTFTDIRYQASGSPYVGNAIVQFDSDGLSVTDCTFSQIGRHGIFFFGPSVTNGVASGNVYTGKGDGDWLDYGIEVGGGAVITATNNTITDCTGIALSDSSSSAGMIVSTYFGPGTAATVGGNFVNDNTTGIFVGYDASDTAVLAAADNDLSGNTWGVIGTSATVTSDASANWWGTNDAASVLALTSGDVDYTPWIDVGTDTDLGSPGFQGDFTTLNVDDDSPQVGAMDRISEGISLVTASTVNVSPGLYSVNLSLSSSVTLNGAQAGVDARGRVVGVPNPLVESVLTAPSGTILRLLGGSAGSVIDGFTFDGAGTAGKGLDSSSGPIDNVQILNNYMVGMTNTPVFLNDSGIDIDIKQNEFDGSTTTVVHLDNDNFDGMHFVDNNVLNGGTGLFVDGNRNVGSSINRASLMSGNLFDGNVTGANLGKRAWETGDITGNTFSNNGPGDGLQGGMKDALIANNTFSDNFRIGLALTSFGDTDPLKGAQGNTITGNTFSGNGRAGLFFSSGQAPGTISTNVANNNDIAGNLPVGVEYGGTEVIDASCNWWGDINGPDAAPTSPNPPGDSLDATTVTFAPWLDGSIVGSPSCNQYGTNNVAAAPSGNCLSITNTCESVPVYFNRTDTSPARGISVTFQLSNNLALCDSVVPANSLPQGTWLTGGTTYLIVDNGNGSYTVDQSTLGSPCGTTTGGLLFNVQVQKRMGAVDGTGTITITDVLVRDCVNVTLPGIPGPPADITIDTGAPAGIGDLSASQVKTGNDADGTTKITLTWSPVEAGATVSVYRKGFGSYPEYDDAGGSVPATPTSPANALGNGWLLSSVTTSGTTDEVASRDFYYFVAFVTDACGNVSAVSNQTDGTLNYHLGDVTNGTPGSGDNQVFTIDVTLLGANYGIALAPADPVNYLDVGPTTDFFVDALPTTDNQVQFEDLMMFAINYGLVSKQEDELVPSAYDELVVQAPSSVESGQIIGVPVWMSGAGVVQGMSVQLGWNERVLEPVGVEAGPLLSAQNGVALTAEPGLLDVAILGTRDQALSGEGTLAQVMFRVIGAGDPQVEIVSIDARDQENQRVDVNVGAKRDDLTQAVPRVTALLQNVPNPFNPMTTVAFTLAKPGQVELAIYDVSGRRVQTLVNAHREAGTHEQVWNGTDGSGARVSSGIYYMRLTTPDGRFSRPMTLLK